MSETPAAPQMLDSSAPIDIDLSCRQCGYNLRGLARGGLCPECGSPVELSTRGNLIQ